MAGAITVQPQLLLPSPTFRSPTAAADQADYRDENVYSAIVLQSTGAGTQRVFSGVTGQAIPALQGTSTATANAHQTKYSDLTTNLVKPGELGASLGDGAVRAIGITLEGAAYVPNTGVSRSFGATQFEAQDILSKCSFEFKVSAKRQIIGPVHAFPSGGGVTGGISTTGNAATASMAQNGWPGTLRRLKLPVEVARTDTIEGIITVGNGATLAFNALAGTDGQPLLMWVNLLCNIQGDVR